MAGLIRFDQLRIALTLPQYPGLEAVTDTVNGQSSIAVKPGTGLSVGTGGVGINLASTVMFSGADWTFGQGELNVIGTSFSTTDVPNADWVLSQIATGVSWRFPVLVPEQLDSTHDSLSGAQPFWSLAIPVANDTLILKSGTVTQTFTFKASESVPFDVAIGGDVATTLANLAAAINADSLVWSAVVKTSLTSLAASVCVIYRTDQDAASVDRIYYGVWTTSTDPKTVTYAGQSEAIGYGYSVITTLAAADPAVKTFGPSTVTPTGGEAHVVLATDTQWIWDADSAAWTQISGTGTVTAGTGLSMSGNTVQIGAAGATGDWNGINRTEDDIGVALATSGTGTGGLAMVTHQLAVDPGSGVQLLASGVAVKQATAIVARQYGGLSRSVSSEGATNAEAEGVGYLGVMTDNSTLEVNASNQVIVKADGITATQIAANAVTIGKLNVTWVEEDFTAASFSTGGDGAYHALSGTPLLGAQVDWQHQCYRNGVADMTNTGSGTAATTADQFRIYTTGGNRVTIGADITGTGNMYRVRYMIATA
jgi:hypothetical protein